MIPNRKGFRNHRSNSKRTRGFPCGGRNLRADGQRLTAAVLDSEATKMLKTFLMKTNTMTTRKEGDRYVAGPCFPSYHSFLSNRSMRTTSCTPPASPDGIHVRTARMLSPCFDGKMKERTLETGRTNEQQGQIKNKDCEGSNGVVHSINNNKDKPKIKPVIESKKSTEELPLTSEPNGEEQHLLNEIPTHEVTCEREELSMVDEQRDETEKPSVSPATHEVTCEREELNMVGEQRDETEKSSVSPATHKETCERREFSMVDGECDETKSPVPPPSSQQEPPLISDEQVLQRGYSNLSQKDRLTLEKFSDPKLRESLQRIISNQEGRTTLLEGLSHEDHSKPDEREIETKGQDRNAKDCLLSHNLNRSSWADHQKHSNLHGFNNMYEETPLHKPRLRRRHVSPQAKINSIKLSSTKHSGFSEIDSSSLRMLSCDREYAVKGLIGQWLKTRSGNEVKLQQDAARDSVEKREKFQEMKLLKIRLCMEILAVVV